MAIVAAAFSAPALATDAPKLKALIQASYLVVRAHVADVTEYDNGRVAVASLRVGQVLKGSAPKGNVSVVEMRDLPVPPLFETGRDVIAFLTTGARNSYLAKHLPAGEYLSPVKVKPGVVTALSAADAESLARIVDRLVPGGQQPERDLTKRIASGRALAFDLLAASHPVFVEDGITTVTGIDRLAASLTADEQLIIEKTLDRADLLARIRVLLIQTIAALDLKQLVPALRRIESPELADAAWAALTKLKAAPAREDMEQRLASTDAQLRSAAIQQLLRQDKAEAIPRAAQVAKTDPDIDVRVAAIEALGTTGAPEAVPVLENIYAVPTWETRQAVGRALMHIGGRTAAEAFERMAFTAPPDAQRFAVVMLMLSVPRDDALLQRVIAKHPDPELRELAEHGVAGHHH